MPLVALITIASLIAYFAITSAVRKYKAFLDSGHDYRRLISAIEKFDDLDGENFARRLGKYPELRKFLTSVRDQIRRKERELEDREKKFKKQMRNDGDNEKFEKECRTLAEAVSDLIRGEVHEDLHITSPGLASIENNLRSFSLDGQETPAGDFREQIGDVIDEFRQAGDKLKSHLSESSTELEASCNAARDLEEQLSAISASFDNAGDVTPGATENLDLEALKQSLKTMQQLCNELSEVGEESKSVAISAALRAGAGEVAVDDVIRLAEDVRKVALNFIELSRSFGDTCDRMRTGVDKIESDSGRLKQLSVANTGVVDSIGALKNKMSLWVERIIVLNDHLKTAEDTANLSLIPINEKLSALSGESERDSCGVNPVEMGPGEETGEDTTEDTTLDEKSANEFELETVDSCAFGGKSPLAFDLPDAGGGAQGIPGIEKNPEHIFTQHEEAGDVEESRVEESHMEDTLAQEQAPLAPDSAPDTEAAFEELPPESEDTQDEPEAGAALEVDGEERIDPDELELVSEDENLRTSTPRGGGFTADRLEGQVAFDLSDDAGSENEEMESLPNALDETSHQMEEAALADDIAAYQEDPGDSIGEDDALEDEKAVDLYSLGAVDIG
jgi:hypothetical protein